MTAPDPASRKPAYPIDPVFLQRWSPRAFQPGVEIPDEVLFTCLEAARWAPSSSNMQPWRFIYTKHGSDRWDVFLDSIKENTRRWTQNCSALVFFVSYKKLQVKDELIPSPTYGFDAGSAFMSFALQAAKMGWHTHAAATFDRAKAPVNLGVPDDWEIFCVVGIGKMGDMAQLPEDLQAREIVSERMPLSRLLMDGAFKPELAAGEPKKPK